MKALSSIIFIYFQFNLLNGENTFVLSLQNNLGVSNTSNTLKYTKSVSSVYVKLVGWNENAKVEIIPCNGLQFDAGYTYKYDFYLEFYYIIYFNDCLYILYNLN